MTLNLSIVPDSRFNILEKIPFGEITSEVVGNNGSNTVEYTDVSLKNELTLLRVYQNKNEFINWHQDVKVAIANNTSVDGYKKYIILTLYNNVGELLLQLKLDECLPLNEELIWDATKGIMNESVSLEFQTISVYSEGSGS